MILCAGHAAFDLFVPLPAFPEEDRKYHLERTEESSGGPASNAASLLGRWGVHVALLAPVGKDAFGAIVRADLEADGVRTDLLRIDQDIPTPLSVILTSGTTGSRTILTRKPERPSLVLDRALLDRLAPAAEIDGPEGVSGLLFDGHEPEVSMALLDRYPHVWSLLDAGTLRPGTERLARRVDYLIASESFTFALAEREGLAMDGLPREGAAGAASDDNHTSCGIAALRHLSDRWVAFTRGGLGCVWQATPAGTIRSMPALSGDVVDTTGAGDIFHGAFAYGLQTETSPARALLWATAAAGLSVRRQGGRASIPTLEETKAIIERGLVSITDD